MEQQSKYQLHQPRDSLNAPSFFIDSATARQNEQMYGRQYGQLRNGERPPPILTNVHRIERPSPKNFTQCSSNTNDDQSNVAEEEDEKNPAADKRNSPEQRVKNKEKRSSRSCCSHRNSRSNQSFDSSYVYCCFCVNPYNSGLVPNQANHTDNCCDWQNCFECESCCQCDSGCPCNCDCGDVLGDCCDVLGACCACLGACCDCLGICCEILLLCGAACGH